MRFTFPLLILAVLPFFIHDNFTFAKENSNIIVNQDTITAHSNSNVNANSNQRELVASAYSSSRVSSTRYPSPAPASDGLYEPFHWPSVAPVTRTPTTGYPTSAPTRFKPTVYQFNITGITHQEYMSVQPDKVFNITVTIYEKTLTKQFINMPAFEIMNADALAKDGWEIESTKLNVIAFDSVNKIRTYGTLAGIRAPGTVGLHQLRWNNGYIESKTYTLEVTCADGIMCNGDERYVYYRDPLSKVLKARCEKSRKALCDDGNDCTTDKCDEATGRCTFIRDSSLPSKKCPLCNGQGCVPKCARRTCGPDSCGGSCGPDCTGNNEYCISGNCQAIGNAKGVCINPYDITTDLAAKKFTGIFDYYGDTSKGYGILRSYCNFQSESKEIIYMIKMPSNGVFTGIDARVVSSSTSYKTGGFDTVMQLIEVNPAEFPNPADGCKLVNNRPDLSVACNDESLPPGNRGSRVTWVLKPGFVYYIQVEGYWVQDAGPFNLTVALTPGCTMKCDGKVCGDSGCGKDFPCQLNKPIPEGYTCKQDDDGARLLKKECKPNCKGRKCGDDGCGGSCGECDFSKGDICSSTNWQCVPIGKCNHYKPRCTHQEKIKGKLVTIDGCPENNFCGVDCKCYDVDDNTDLPDLYINDSTMDERDVIDDYEVKASDCAYDEGCIATLGKRRIFRFPTLVGNQGRKDFAAASPPELRPDIYVWGACHGHWHFDGFAEFALLSKDKSQIVIEGGKRSFCAEDSMQVLEFPSAPCLPKHDCTKQGVSIGWVDIYSKNLDCQFLDITNVAPGDYILKQCTNVKRTYEELSRANNCMYYPVTIPKLSETKTKSPTYD